MTSIRSLAAADVKAATDLAQLIGEVTALTHSAAAHGGLCPFHHEMTPSFFGFGDRTHCFGCGRHGDAAKWRQERRQGGRSRGLEPAPHRSPFPRVDTRRRATGPEAMLGPRLHFKGSDLDSR